MAAAGEADSPGLNIDDGLLGRYSAGVWLGWRLHGTLDERQIYRAVTALKLLWDGVSGYLRRSSSSGATAITPPVRPIASADLVDFAGSGFVSVATALLTNCPCTGLGVGSTTAALGFLG